MSALLRASDLSHAYTRAPVLDHVDLELPPGRMLIVVGPNGSGKTTLARVLSGVLRPDSGRVELGGAPLAAFSRRDIARRLAVVPQDTWGPFPYTVREMVAMGRAPSLGAFGREGPKDREIVAGALAELELTGLSERDYPTLSGGEKQRVLLARARAQDTSTLLLDEPTAHMDLGHRLRCFEWLRAWIDAQREARAVAVITHDLLLAARFADVLLLLAAGRVVASGAPGEVLTPQRIAEVYGVEARVERDAGGGLHIHPLGSIARPAR